MNLSRRSTLLGLGAFGLSACGTGGTLGPRAGTTDAAGLPADLRPAANPAYDAWVTNFRSRAVGQGISSNVLAVAFRNTGYLPGVVKRDRNQTEFSRTLEDYLAIAASDERVAKGRAAFSRYRNTLAAVEARYGVAAEIVTAIWGLESFYGERRGNVPVISSTSTLAFDGRRGAFFEKQLVAALKILQSGDTTAANLKGSWAGAMGHTQFIPTSYQAFAVDFNGDGRRDIWSENPEDSLASTAAYLSRNGWTKGRKWGGEFGNNAPSGRMIQPQAGGPRFAVTSNFNVIKRYNNSDSYAIGVGHLADRIAGGGPIRASFPPDKYGLTKDDRVRLQQRLTAKGFDTGGSDGVVGPNSRKAISAYQGSIGQQPTGDPSQELLRSLE
ncbi:lytic murein transglycosylase [Sulfitobacter sp. F26204]|uniref:lytic murein transglycosylase n=1 Tax=Sulfitobacter sp. F26204 TaxID=2996014 RepID=UPI00225E5C20|nr:lytic murein transglycosylase [Sulfitobacter sp. F26204]MCX7560402.1 lytic murein transglycosylase [Sulfitobacter sp. F26204]